jgi:hypothetical protein
VIIVILTWTRERYSFALFFCERVSCLQSRGCCSVLFVIIGSACCATFHNIAYSVLCGCPGRCSKQWFPHGGSQVSLSCRSAQLFFLKLIPLTAASARCVDLPILRTARLSGHYRELLCLITSLTHRHQDHAHDHGSQSSCYIAQGACSQNRSFVYSVLP